MNQLTEWVYNSTSRDFWILTGALVVFTIIFFGCVFYFLYRKRIMEDTPTSKVRSAAQGYVELHGSGELMEGPPIIAPLTGITCTWYDYRIEERQFSGNKSEYVTIEKGNSTELFLFADDTGKCIIDPEGAEVTTASCDVWYGKSKHPQRGPPAKRGLLSFFRGGKYKYTERRLHPREPLYAIGLYKTVGGVGGESSIDADVRDLLREWKHNSEALLAKYDKNHDGQIDMDEWQAVRDGAFKVVMARRQKKKSAPPVNVMGKTLRRRLYMLSAIPQEILTRRYYLCAMGFLFGFFALGSLSTLMIAIRMAMAGN